MVVLKLFKWSYAVIVKDAATPAVTRDSPGPRAVLVLAHVAAGDEATVNGLPRRGCSLVNIRVDGIVLLATDGPCHARVTAALLTDESRYCSLMSNRVFECS